MNIIRMNTVSLDSPIEEFPFSFILKLNFIWIIYTTLKYMFSSATAIRSKQFGSFADNATSFAFSQILFYFALKI